MNYSKQGNDSETSSEEIDQPEKLACDDNAGMGRSYECNFCKRGFTNAQALGGHMNIHRKDKAKLAKSKQVPTEPSISNKFSQEYMACGFFPPYLSDPKRYYSSYGSHMGYQTFIPIQNPSFWNGNLSLGMGTSYVEENEEKMRGGTIDINNEEVDLELRLGYYP